MGRLELRVHDMNKQLAFYTDGVGLEPLTDEPGAITLGLGACGEDDPAELMSRVKDGIYATSFGGGQVDITSGKFVFACTEAYKVQNGKIVAPIKGATLIGDGPSVLTKVRGIGNDMELDQGIGVCGKGGQGVPAGVGQPTLLIEGITVGGTG